MLSFKKLPELEEWLPLEISKIFNNVSWKESIIKIHNEDINSIKKTKYFKNYI